LEIFTHRLLGIFLAFAGLKVSVMRYSLLRNNEESGPYTKSQLIGIGLQPNDLVCMEDKYAVWRYPSEIEGLKSYVKKNKEAYFLSPAKSEFLAQNPPVTCQEALPQTKFSQSPGDLKKQHAATFANPKPASSKKHSLITPLLLALPVLILGIIIGIKWKNDGQPTIIAVQPVTRAAGVFPGQNSDDLGNTVLLQNNDSTKNTSYRSLDADSLRNEGTATVQSNTNSKGKTATSFSRRKIEDIVTVKASFKQGKSGIKDIKLNVTNQSYLNLDLVVIDLFYVDENNKVIEKETIYLKNIDTKEVQPVDAPNGGHQTKNIRYKVMLVTARDGNLHLVSR
jgi:hypothetical protein